MGSRPVLVIPNISLASFGYAPSVAVAMRFPSLRRDRVPVTGAAHLRVLLPQALGVEPRAVGIDSPGAQRRMAREAVVFHVTRSEERRVGKVCSSTTSTDIMRLQDAYANFHTHQERDYFRP